MDIEQVRSAEDAGLWIVCGSVALDGPGLAALRITDRSDGDDIVRAAVLLADHFELDVAEAASSLADLVQEMRWFQEED